MTFFSIFLVHHNFKFFFLSIFTGHRYIELFLKSNTGLAGGNTGGGGWSNNDMGGGGGKKITISTHLPYIYNFQSSASIDWRSCKRIS